ncbi:MAG: hypothetical protein IMW89_05625 [Ktedonobacteraceae bacterium]|nr:hypothetical protein [Ktedonobacteraceae bacterium]
MQNATDRCKHLRRLHSHLTGEIRALKELREEELENFENPVVTVDMIKSLQDALNTVNRELEQCPPEE